VLNRDRRPLSSRLVPVLAAALLAITGTAAVAAVHRSGAHPAAGPSVIAPVAGAEFAPASTGTRLLRQPDGRFIRVTLTDPRVGGLFETAAGGYSIARVGDGAWRYVLGRTPGGRLRLSRAEVGHDPVPAGVRPHAGRHAVKVSAKEAAMSASIQRQLQVASYQAQMKAAAAGKVRIYKVPALMFATWWDPAKGQTEPQFQSGHDTKYFKKILSGFGGNPRGSVTQYYWESSVGQFRVEIDVYGPYVSNRSRQNRCYYGDIGEAKPPTDLDPLGTAVGAGGGGAIGMATEVVPEADPTVDFANYDNNGDGKVDFLIIIHSGGDMAVTGDPCNTWSHAAQMTLGEGAAVEQQLGLPPGTLGRAGMPTNDGVTVDRVLTIAEFESAADPLTIGVASHEMAHSLGEPDYYDTTYNSVGTGDYDIMSGGSYLGNPSGSDPAMQNPATRVFQGWLTPTIVHKSLRHVVLKPRTIFPSKHYHVGIPDPNLLLVPTYEIKQGQKDKLGHTWTQFDTYGLAKDPKTHKYVVEGFYVENVNRVAKSPAEHKGEKRGSFADRMQHGSGLIVWHFDYWKQANTYYGGNDAETDVDRYQMDVEEFDRNDNTQELQLDYSRGNVSDYLIGAATGITSGTHQLPPGSHKIKGHPQKPIDLSGTTPPAGSSSQTFTVTKTKNNAEMTVSAGSTNPAGDCKLTLVDPKGKAGPENDSNGAGAPETTSVKRPMPGKWMAKVSDFAGCLQWRGRVIFSGPDAYTTRGAADSWSNWTKKPTGWAFTNVGPRTYDNGLDASTETLRSGAISLDILNLAHRRDVSPGFISGRHNHNLGTAGVNAGVRNRMIVPVFSNGRKAAGKVTVEIRANSAHGALIARKHVKLGGYSRRNVAFRYRPAHEGVFHLYAIVDPRKKIREADEKNNVQMTEGWAGPARPKVLVVDDDGLLTQERVVEGSLASLGIPYAVVSDHATYAQMRKYKAVIWDAGVDRAAVARYLNHGGRILFTSNRLFDAVGVGESSTTPQSTSAGVRFGAHYLGERIPETSYTATQELPVTVSGRGLFHGLKIRIAPAPTRPFDDFAALSSTGQTSIGETTKPFGKARGLLTARMKRDYPAVRVQPGGTPFLGISVDGDAKHHHFKTVSLGFNLAQATSAGVTVRVVRAVMRHFGVHRHAYRVAGTTPVVYDSSVRSQVSGRPTPITAVVLGGHGKLHVTLHYRRHALGHYYAKVMRRGKVHGTYTAVIPGRGATPDGIDYYIEAVAHHHATFSPALASSGKVAHTIGIGLPEIRHPLPVLKVVATASAASAVLFRW
jgi:M6 family metalloprotease-like protein